VHPTSHAAYPIILSFDFLQVGAIGRLWAALLSPNRRGLKSAFDEMPWHRKPAFNEWMADVDAVRKIGYAADRGNVTPDVTVVAAPLFDPLGELSFFLTIMYLETEVDEKRLAQVGTEARIAAEEIRHELAMRSLMGSATAQK
ncbi:IclR family transcriptional regulator C-terminal domain-containing protein, partial [Rhizobiaceae sp. 2RAB30]